MPHPDGSVDPWRDLEQLDLEFVLADLSVIEKRIEKLSTSGRHGTPAERESNERELAVLEKLAPALREGKPIRDLELGDDEQKRIRGFRFLTEKPVLVLLNIGEADIAARGRDRRRLRARATRTASRRSRRCRREIEMEIGQLDAEEAEVFRTDLGPDRVDRSSASSASATGCSG